MTIRPTPPLTNLTWSTLAASCRRSPGDARGRDPVAGSDRMSVKLWTATLIRAWYIEVPGCVISRPRVNTRDHVQTADTWYANSTGVQSGISLTRMVEWHSMSASIRDRKCKFTISASTFECETSCSTPGVTWNHNKRGASPSDLRRSLGVWFKANFLCPTALLCLASIRLYLKA